MFVAGVVIDFISLLRTAKPTPWCLGSSTSLPFQKKVYSFSFIEPVSGSRVSCKPAISTSSRFSSSDIIAVFLNVGKNVSVDCPMDSPGHMVRTFHVPNENCFVAGYLRLASQFGFWPIPTDP